MHGLRAKCTSNDGFDRKALRSLGEATHRKVRYQARQSSQEGGTEAQQENRNPEGLGGGCALLSSHHP